MAIGFNDTKGSAKKGSFDQYAYKMGDNKVRIIGGILPRYVYWIKGMNDKNIPIECLSFERETETFKNQEKDWIPEFYPDLKCTWAYAILCYDYDQKKIVVLNLKKKLLEQIMTTAGDLGDPTDHENGWDICFERKKTGPNAFNVEYTIQALKCNNSKGPITKEIKEAFEATKSIDEIMPRPEAASQKTFLDSLNKQKEGGEDKVDSEVEDVFDIEQKKQ